VLGLVELSLDEGDRGAVVGHGLAVFGDHIGLVPAHQFGTGDGDGWRDLHRAEHGLECRGLGRVVVGEQPEPVIHGFRRRRNGEGALHGGAEIHLAGGRHELSGSGCRKQFRGAVAGPGIHGDYRIGSPGLASEPREGSFEVRRPRPGNEYRGDSRLHPVETKRARRSARRDTHERPI
jgi:hypothetical protein